VKLLLDQNLSFRFLDQLSARFPGSTQTRIAGLDRASDLQVWEYAKQNDLKG
jgi:predicted nuclease of predicted toxin-antitoxin system